MAEVGVEPLMEVAFFPAEEPVPGTLVAYSSQA